MDTPIRNDDWVDYGGIFSYTGTSGVVDLGFEAISAPGGIAAGNFLDRIQITLRPFVEFAQTTYLQTEDKPALNVPQLRVAGTVPAGGMNVRVTITGGTATLGVDYLTPGNATSFDVFIPAGVYDDTLFNLPVTLVDDGLGDPGETITFALEPTTTADPYNVASLRSCGGAPQTAATTTINEAEPVLPRLQLNKALASNRIATGDQFTLRIVGTNGVQTTTTGTGSTIGSGSIQVAPAAAGTSYTLREIMATGSTSALTAYAPSISCTNTTPQSTTVLPSGAGSDFSLTIAAGDNISCTLTNRSTTAPAGLRVVKSVTSGSFYDNAGDVATYSYVVTNTGSTALSNLVVSDNKIASVNCGGITALAVGASVTCTGSYTVTQADVDATIVTNIVRATARNLSNQTLTATDDAVISLAVPTWTLDKRALSPTYAAVGDTVDYEYVVTNTGNVTINAIAVTDDRIATVSCPASTLAAGARMTCTASYTVTQVDLDAGSVTNIATATGTPTGGTLSTLRDQATITGPAAAPALTLAKTVTSGSPYDSVGDVVDYRYVVTNTGNVTINSLVVTDDKIATVTCPVTTLAPGASTTCTASYTTTQADLDAGSVTNNATADGTPVRGTLVPAADSAVATATGLPSLTMDKTVNSGSPYDSVGDVVSYRYVVTNTGNVRVNALAVSDDKIATVTCPVTTLAPGASTTCTASYAITQADLDAGSVTNIATATGTPTQGTLTPATDSAVATATAQPALTLVKTAVAGAPYDAVGDVVDYQYAVTNTGNVTVSALAVGDDKIATVTCPVTTLAPGASTTCTASYTVTQADLDAGSVTNTATATGSPARGTLAPATDSATVNSVATPALTLDKSIALGSPYNEVGDLISYRYVVTNTGRITINALTVSDDKIATVTCPATTLAPGASTTCAGAYTVTQADLDAGSVTNNASATGTPRQGSLVPATDSAVATGIATPSLSLVKRVVSGNPYDAIGDTVGYTYEVTNTGNVTIDALAVTDDKIATVSCPVTTLAPGARTTCTGTYTIVQADVDAGSVTNHASATGTPASGALAPATDDAVATSAATPSLTLVKTAVAGDPYDAVGDGVDYTYVVTNPSAITINALTVSDDKIATVSCPVTTLAPGASTTCTGSYTITQADLDAGTVTNVATANGVPASGTLVPGRDVETVAATASPALTLVKTAVSGVPYDSVGDVIGYTYVVTNTGNITINDLVVDDDRILAVSCPVTSLAPGASTTCTASYTVTQADLDAGSVTNRATATGSPPALTPPTAVETVDADASPSLTLDKTAVSGVPYDAVGDVVAYTYVVTNTGNVTIDALGVSDDKIAAVTCPVTTLAPGAGTTCTATYTVTQADLDAGSVTNNASATGTPAQGVLTPATDAETVVATTTPALTLDKSAASGTPYDAVGDVVTYDYLVTNTGNITISALVVSDDRIATVTCPVTTLAPGASTTCTASYTIAQADLDAGSVTNNASATGTPASGSLSPATDSVTVNATTTPALTLDKSAVSGVPYTAVGDVVTYDYVVTNTGNVTISALAVSDDRIATVTCPVTTLAPGASTTCTAAYTITQADLDAGSVTNNASATGTPASGTLAPATDSVTVGARALVQYAKTANTPGPVAVGDTIGFALTVTVAYAPTTSAVILTDTLGPGLTFNAVTTPGAFTCTATGNVLTCTLPAGQAPGTYTVGYSATVDATATGTVDNAVTGASGDPQDPAPTCGGTCTTATPVAPPAVRYAKVADTAGPVRVGDVITYTLTATVSQSQTTAVTTLTDTLGTGLAFGAVTDAGVYTCSATATVLTCTLPAGTVPGTYPVVYTATVTNQAPGGGTVDNAVTGRSADPSNPPTCEGTCTVQVTVIAAEVDVVKTSDPAPGTELEVGQGLTYTLTATVSGAALNGDVVLTDTPDAGLTIGTLPAGCVQGGGVITCTLPAGTAPGTYTFTYPATINDQAGATVGNAVTATSNGNLIVVTCASCATQHVVAASDLRIAKVAAVRQAHVGDLVRYTLTVQNLGNGRLRNGTIVDTPPAGFTYVAGSLVVDDEDDAGTAEGAGPVRFGGLDIAGHGTATLVYLVRVGAGVRPGVHENSAQAFSPTTGEPISNIATARVEIVADPLVDDSLVFGTVFNDCNGDGTQTPPDERGIPGVRIVSVEGLVAETDRYGRYHLAGIPGGPWERGRNFILKVDPATLPANAEFTTDNPLLKRITPGVPVRFDWGVKRCVKEIQELQLGTVLFAPGSAQIREQHGPVIAQMAATVNAHGGGEVVIAADGEGEGLALARATAVREALVAQLEAAVAAQLSVSVRADVNAPDTLVTGVGEGGLVLGTVLFDTDAATIRPEFDALLDQVAAVLERTQGGVVTIVGHTDVRGSHTYNAALGLRRAQAVQEALVQRLSPALQAKVRVRVQESEGAPALPGESGR
ncbi:OmpA family protein [Lysobacter yangpyeongensis]|uniref:OmpA family protein n=1 Tax=Lysobacter yangpyeongensis TaxID=346182 RepID=A0ABW0SJ38_9GAMM